MYEEASKSFYGAHGGSALPPLSKAHGPKGVMPVNCGRVCFVYTLKFETSSLRVE